MEVFIRHLMRIQITHLTFVQTDETIHLFNGDFAIGIDDNLTGVDISARLAMPNKQTMNIIQVPGNTESMITNTFAVMEHPLPS